MTQPAQAAAAPLKVYVAATSDFPASAMEKRLLEAQEFQTGSVVVVSKVADADAVIQVGGDTTWPYYEYQFRLWSLPSEALVASGKVSEPDETKAFTHLVQEVVKAIRTVQDSPKPASKPKGPPTTGELQGYVLKRGRASWKCRMFRSDRYGLLETHCWRQGRIGRGGLPRR